MIKYLWYKNRFYTYIFIGGIMIKIGDYVTRKSYQNDIIFKVIGIQGDNVILAGACIRLHADSLKDDLVLYAEKIEEDDFGESFNDYKTLDRNEFFYLPGKVLHIDRDISLSNNLLNLYKIREKAKNQKYIDYQKIKKRLKII